MNNRQGSVKRIINANYVSKALPFPSPIDNRCSQHLLTEQSHVAYDDQLALGRRG